MFAIFGVHMLAVMSPGPDFVVVMRQALQYGHRSAYWTSLGICVTNLFHISYCLLGLGYLMIEHPEWLLVLRYVGAAYLVYLAWHIYQDAGSHLEANTMPKEETAPTPWQAFRLGVSICLLNPKAALYYLMLFSLLLGPEFEHGAAFWGLLLAMLSFVGLWFCAVSYFFTRTQVREAFFAAKPLFLKGVSFILFAIAVKIASGG